MNSENGRIEVVNVVNIEFVDNGRSLRLEIIDSIPPHSTRFVTFKNAYGVSLFQSGDEEFPMVVIDLTWREVSLNEKEQMLSTHHYPIFDESGRPIALKRRLVAAHLEGAIVGDVLAEEIIIASA